MGFLSIDGTFWVQVVDLIVFILVLNVVFLKPVGAAIAKRRAHLDQLAADIAGAEGEVRALHAQAEERRATARRTAEEAVAAARARGQKEAAAIAGEFGAQASALVEEARSTVEAETAAARSGEERIVDDLAKTMVDRAIGGVRA